MKYVITGHQGLIGTKLKERLDLEGNEIDCFGSMNEAEKKTKISAYNISGCVRGKQKTAGGFIWIFKDR